MNRLRILAIVVFGVLLLGGGAGFVWVWQTNRDSSSQATAKTNQNNESSQNQPAIFQTAPEEAPPFDKSLYSTTDPASVWIIVNKARPLPSGYAPSKLVTPDVPTRLAGTAEQSHVSDVIALPLKALFDAATTDNVYIKLSSGYRSEALQKQFYDSYVARDGQAAADTYSARPGTSEHQTGLAVDIIASSNACNLETCFGDMAEGKWLAAHAHEYGFIIRYPEGKQDITTYRYEPWHLRYVGVELAQELHTTNHTMEEFFGVY